MTSPFAIALGSNRGDRAGNLAEAAVLLTRVRGLSHPRLSGIYESGPAEGVGGGPFLNAVMAGLWSAGPHALLDAARSVEAALGSPVRKAGSDRTIDIDILFVGSEVVRDCELVLPHPRIARREFVLRPLGDVMGDRPIPVLGRSAADLLAGQAFHGDITEVVPPPPPGEIWSGV